MMDDEKTRLFSMLAGASSRTVVPLNGEAERSDSMAPAFFCVHAITGLAAGDFAELAGEMPENTRFFAVQAPAKLMAAFNETPRLDLILENHLNAILAAQPNGPINLGGWSSGALLALELARKIKAQGREVGLLAAIDGAPKRMKIGTSRLGYFVKVALNLPSALTHDPKQLFARVFSKLHRKRTRDSAFAGHPVLGVVNDFDRFPPQQQMFMRNLFDAIEAAVDFAIYDGAIVVYRAKLQPIGLSGVSEFWRRVAPGCDIVDINGSHAAIVFRPNARRLAADLARRLA